jgi:hypothetical protein
LCEHQPGIVHGGRREAGIASRSLSDEPEDYSHVFNLDGVKSGCRLFRAGGSFNSMIDVTSVHWQLCNSQNRFDKLHRSAGVTQAAPLEEEQRLMNHTIMEMKPKGRYFSRARII